MSRFGSTGTFSYQTGDAITAGTTLVLTSDSMPNYPFETFEESDRKIHKSKTGRKYVYQNYNLQGYKFNFTNIKESMRNSLKQMFDAKPLLTFNSNNTLWGTFRFDIESWQDQETAYQLYDLNFSVVEDF